MLGHSVAHLENYSLGHLVGQSVGHSEGHSVNHLVVHSVCHSVCYFCLISHALPCRGPGRNSSLVKNGLGGWMVGWLVGTVARRRLAVSIVEASAGVEASLPRWTIAAKNLQRNLHNSINARVQTPRLVDCILTKLNAIFCWGNLSLEYVEFSSFNTDPP